MTGDEPAARHADRVRRLHERLRLGADHLRVEVLADLGPSDERQRRDEAGHAERPRDKDEHDREKQLRDRGDSRRHSADDPRERTAEPAARNTEGETDRQARDCRRDDDREAEPSSSEHARPLVPPEGVRPEPMVEVGKRGRDAHRAAAVGSPREDDRDVGVRVVGRDDPAEDADCE